MPHECPVIQFFSEGSRWAYASQETIARLQQAAVNAMQGQTGTDPERSDQDPNRFVQGLTPNQVAEFVQHCRSAAAEAGFRIVDTTPDGMELYGREIDGQGELIALATSQDEKLQGPGSKRGPQIGWQLDRTYSIYAHNWDQLLARYHNWGENLAYLAWFLDGDTYQVLRAAHKVGPAHFDKAFELYYDEPQQCRNLVAAHGWRLEEDWAARL